MTKGLVSIITPCYNGEKYIGETIDSVLSQTYTDWEMIIIDDGSKDNSAEVIKQYTDPRIKYFRQENAGSAAARNNGLRRAEGQYIALLDADDLWRPEFLEKQIKIMKEKNVICVACSYDHIDDQSKPILSTTKVKEVITIKDMKKMNQIGCLSGLYDCSRHGKIFLKEELKSLRDDYAYWYDIVALEGRAYGNQEVLADYRVLSNSTTGDKKKLIKIQYRFYRLYLKENPLEAGVNLIKWGISGLKKFT
ncbi:MAG: glycosyltransferase family 2 protein [Clostridia bacterium]|nr:glycosyltransferase family 2 protein [Clostridia bacterium]